MFSTEPTETTRRDQFLLLRDRCYRWATRASSDGEETALDAVDVATRLTVCQRRFWPFALHDGIYSTANGGSHHSESGANEPLPLRPTQTVQIERYDPMQKECVVQQNRQHIIRCGGDGGDVMVSLPRGGEEPSKVLMVDAADASEVVEAMGEGKLASLLGCTFEKGKMVEGTAKQPTFLVGGSEAPASPVQEAALRCNIECVNSSTGGSNSVAGTWFPMTKLRFAPNHNGHDNGVSKGFWLLTGTVITPPKNMHLRLRYFPNHDEGDTNSSSSSAWFSQLVATFDRARAMKGGAALDLKAHLAKDPRLSISTAYRTVPCSSSLSPSRQDPNASLGSIFSSPDGHASPTLAGIGSLGWSFAGPFMLCDPLFKRLQTACKDGRFALSDASSWWQLSCRQHAMAHPAAARRPSYHHNDPIGAKDATAINGIFSAHSLLSWTSLSLEGVHGVTLQRFFTSFVLRTAVGALFAPLEVRNPFFSCPATPPTANGDHTECDVSSIGDGESTLGHETSASGALGGQKWASFTSTKYLPQRVFMPPFVVRGLQAPQSGSQQVAYAAGSLEAHFPLPGKLGRVFDGCLFANGGMSLLAWGFGSSAAAEGDSLAANGGDHSASRSPSASAMTPPPSPQAVAFATSLRRRFEHNTSIGFSLVSRRPQLVLTEYNEVHQGRLECSWSWLWSELAPLTKDGEVTAEQKSGSKKFGFTAQPAGFRGSASELFKHVRCGAVWEMTPGD